MFSGIIEATAAIRSFRKDGDVFRLQVSRPPEFTDIKRGDSIAVNGVCLTVEVFTSDSLQFALGPETQMILQMSQEGLKIFENKSLNLERSLQFGDRMHGHLVTGHAEGLATLLSREVLGESLVLNFALPLADATAVWTKGSVTLNGVSLTVNSVSSHRAKAVTISVCLIPETLKKTNLGALQIGDPITFETDWMAKLWKAKATDHQSLLENSILRVNLDAPDLKHSAMQSYSQYSPAKN